jgi:hypothetical protein
MYVILCIQVCVWYLGDRCHRQLTGIIAIPRDPPAPMSYISQHDYCEPVAADTLVHLVSQSIYDEYWARVSVGAIQPTLLHATNVDFIGPASISDPTVRFPHQPPPFWCPGGYNTQPRPIVPSRHGEFFVEVPVSGGGRVTKALEQELIQIESRDQLSYVSLLFT